MSESPTKQEAKADILFHPVRMRITLALVGREMTAQQIALQLADVPQATLYRHLNRLVAAGITRVVGERQVRGAAERTYALNEGAATLARATPEDHMRYFATFVATLLSDFGRYLKREHIDFAADGVGYRQIALYLSDEEMAKMAEALSNVLVDAARNTPAPGRQRRVFTTIVMPGADDADAGNAEN